MSTQKNTQEAQLFFNGEKLSTLENLASVQSFCAAIDNDKYSSFDLLEEDGLRHVVSALLTKYQDANCRISNTAYSAVMIYADYARNKYHVYAGANIDPARPEWLKNPEYRNCAEKQAWLSASRDGFSKSELVAMLLYRRQEPAAVLAEEKLLPCLDCTRNYLYELVNNKGKLLVILPNNAPRNFFIDTNLDLDSNHISAIMVPDENSNIDPLLFSNPVAKRLLHYKIFKPTELNFLKIEKQLGARVNQP